MAYEYPRQFSPASRARIERALADAERASDVRNTPESVVAFVVFIIHVFVAELTRVTADSPAIWTTTQVREATENFFEWITGRQYAAWYLPLAAPRTQKTSLLAGDITFINTEARSEVGRGLAAFQARVHEALAQTALWAQLQQRISKLAEAEADEVGVTPSGTESVEERVARRRGLLERVKQATNCKLESRFYKKAGQKVPSQSPIHWSDFCKWRDGSLANDSATTQNFERWQHELIEGRRRLD